MERKASPAVERDALDDSWFDLPVISTLPKKERHDPENDALDDSWFDRPGRGLRRSDVLGR